MKQMRELLLKDYRLNRGLLILGALGLTGVYLVGAATEISHTWPAIPAAKVWADALYSYGHLALSVMPFIAALLGGNAIACERADRSAHFLAYLPPTKAQILASKFMVAVCALAIFLGGNAVSMYAVAPLLSPEPTNFLYMLGTPSAALAGCVLTFGIGWLGSACLEKPTIPVLAALVFPFVLGYGLFTFAAVSGISRFEVAEWGGAVGLSVGVTAFSVGTWCYFRRIEP
jgi:ABC-type transport system involved in multi-copper enzyme maturation permease subunit